MADKATDGATGSLAVRSLPAQTAHAKICSQTGSKSIPNHTR
jgi:hypothetical protein